MFTVNMGSAVVGSANISRKGLYYHVQCTCDLPGNALYRIIMRNGRTYKDLGICVPEGNVFTLFKRVSVKQFQGNDFTFEIVCENEGEYAVSDNVPFAHLDKLESARLRQTNGQMKIIIDPTPVPQDSDQNREHPNR